MAYKEPGAYSNLVTNSAYAAGNATALIPLIIGGGASILRRTEVITRAASGDDDTLPMNAVSIISVGTTTRKPTYFQSTEEETKDFTFTTGEDTITWESEGNKPAAGEKYYVTFTFNVTDAQFEPQLITETEDIIKFFGPTFKENEPDANTGVCPINRLSLAAQIAKEAGAPAIYVLQVKPNTVSHIVTSVEYVTALEKAEALGQVWRIVPTDIGADINNAIDAHVEEMSSYEERKERTAIYGVENAGETLTSFASVLSTVGGYAEGKAYKRVSVIYPDLATKLLSDGAYHVLDSAFINAAYAGTEAALPIYRSKTRATINVFHELKGVQLKRSQMNLLAEKGVMLLTQPNGAGTNIIIRHQLTTDVSSVQTKENSIVMVADYAAKRLRNVCEAYVGKFNVTGETIARLQGALDSEISALKKAQIITDGNITQIAQDEINPDSILVSVRIAPPYPCNYIEITLYLD